MSLSAVLADRECGMPGFANTRMMLTLRPSPTTKMSNNKGACGTAPFAEI